MKAIITLLSVILYIHKSDSIFDQNFIPSHIPANTFDGDPGQPLFLTPHIESGHIDEARELSRVNGLPNAPNLTSYSGFLTVNKQYNSNMFFWYFPAMV